MFAQVVGFALISCVLGVPQLGGLTGGIGASMRVFPYQVSIESKEAHTCSGSLYSESVVITAASCVLNQKVPRLQVRAGSNDMISGGELVDVKSYIMHPEFNRETRQNDVALIKLAKALPLSKTIRPIKLALSTPVEGTAFLSGWETENSFSSFSNDILQYLYLDIVETEKCIQNEYGRRIKPGMICASATDDMSCLGDTGAPLAFKGTLIGILSWGKECVNNKKHTAIFTDIADVKSWIIENV